MKKLLTIFFLLVCTAAFSQRKSWFKQSILQEFVNGVKANRFYLQPQIAPVTVTDDTTSGFFWLNDADTSVYLNYKGVNRKLNGGNTTINNSGGSLTQNTKDTTVTFTGNRTYVDIPAGISYTPVNIEITIVSANSTAGDTGEGFSYAFLSESHVLRIIYPAAAPLGTFTYHIVFTKSS